MQPKRSVHSSKNANPFSWDAEESTMRLQGTTAVVTGAGAGYGAAMAQRFGAEGARVACVDINHEAAQAIADTMAQRGHTAMALRCDVSDSSSVATMCDEVVRQWGGFNALINNAALTQKPARIAKTPEPDVDRLLAVNIKSLYHMAVHAVPVIRKAGSGSIINIASVTGLRPRPGMIWYNATKAAVLSITQSMAAELAADGIRVNAIAPVAGRTPMFDSMFGEHLDEGISRVLETIPLGRLCDPEDIANAAVYLTSGEASYITGIVLPVDGGRLVG